MYDFINIDHIIENKTYLDKYDYKSRNIYSQFLRELSQMTGTVNKSVAKPPNTMKLNDIYLSNIKPKK